MILTRFDDGGARSHVVVMASAARDGQALRLHYELRGDLGGLSLPPPATTPRRADGLWRDTCFEAFLASPGSVAYREVNLSPSGDWNVYRFRSYREGGAPDPAITGLSLRVVQAIDAVELDVVLAVAPGPLEVGLTAVIGDRAGQLGYWALRHDGPRPDFHLRSSFVLSIPTLA